MKGVINSFKKQARAKPNAVEHRSDGVTKNMVGKSGLERTWF